MSKNPKDPNMNAIDIEIKTVEEAPHYRTGERGGEGFKQLNLTKAIIIRQGMESGRDTIDLQFVDEHGNKYVAFKTAWTLKTVTSMCNIGE